MAQRRWDQPTTVWVNVTNSACSGADPARCSVTVPFGDTASASLNCTNLTGPLAFSHAYSAVGTYSVGTGGSVDYFPSGTCSGAPQTRFPLSPGSVSVVPATIVTLAASPSVAADVGQPISLTASAHGGAPPYTFLWNGLPPGCTDQNLSTLSCAPTGPGDFQVVVQANDTVGGGASATLFYHVDPAPSVKVIVLPSTADVGQTIEVIAAASNGSGDYQFIWSGTPPGCAPANVSSFSCSPTSSGRFSIALAVTDSRGIVITSHPVAVTVNPALGVQLSASSSSPAAGDTVVLYSAVTGGTGPFNYSWTGLPSSCDPPTVANESCTPGAGNYEVTVTVQDSVGGHASASYHLTVTAPSSTVFGLPLYVLGGLLVLVAVLVVVAVVLSRRRARSSR